MASANRRAAPGANAQGSTEPESSRVEDVSRRPVDARAVWLKLRPSLDALDPTAVLPLRGNLQLAATMVLGVVEVCRRPDVRERFERLAKAGFFSMATLDEMERGAHACVYTASRHRLASGTRLSARISDTLDADSRELRDRMFSCAEHTLDDVPEGKRIVDEVRPGSGYLDRANDLIALAELYHRFPEVVRLDGKKFRAGDETEAMHLAAEIFRELGIGERADDIDWYDQQHRAWVYLAQRYLQARRWGVALFEADGETMFPDLHASSRAPWGSRREQSAQDDTPANDGAKPAETPASNR